MKLSLLPLIAASVISFSSANAQHHHQNDLVRHAHSIIGIAGDLRNEFRIHYAHSGAYRHLMADVSQIIGEAQHIDRLAHNPHSSYRHILQDLKDLDRLSHHLHDVVDAVARGRYSGHVDGHTHHVHTKLAALNGTIHSMQRAVAFYATPIHHHHHDHHGHRRDAVSVIVNGLLNSAHRHHGHGHHGH